MTPRLLHLAALLALALPLTAKSADASPPSAAEKPSASRPNIILILVDDMGFSDLGCYGSEIPTPNLDALAAGGLRFTQFYNAGRCCPTRASLLTGLYPHQAGVGGMTNDKGTPGYRGFLNDRCVTLAEVLKPAGYFTAHTGKWHVGHGDDARLPLQRGFDRFYGVPEGGGFYFTPKAGRTVRLGNEVVHDPGKPTPDGWYSTDAWTDYGLRFIDEALAAKQPFFLYLAHNAPHFPLQAAPEDIAKFRGKYKAGWDRLREERHARQKELGVVAPSWPLTPRDATIAAWESLDAAKQDELDLRMAIYAAVMDRLDRAIGTLVAGLKERGVLDNTLILFLSDNGASDEGGLYGKNGPGEPGSAESDVFLGRAWANACDTPFRLYKKNSHEGGIATPLIAHWPAGIAVRGEWRTQPGHVVDIMATCVDLAGATYPREHKDRAIHPMEAAVWHPHSRTRPCRARGSSGNTRATPLCAMENGNSSASAETARGNSTTWKATAPNWTISPPPSRKKSKTSRPNGRLGPYAPW